MSHYDSHKITCGTYSHAVHIKQSLCIAAITIPTKACHTDGMHDEDRRLQYTGGMDIFKNEGVNTAA